MANEERLQEELASFRQEWHEEIQRQTTESSNHSSRHGSPSIETPPQSRRSVQTPSPVNQSAVNTVNKHSLSVPSNTEEQASHLFIQGVSAERSGNLYEAIHYYRQAIQLVPDIESKISDFTLASTGSDDENVDDANFHPLKTPEHQANEQQLADLSNRCLKLTVTGICQPHFETKTTTISSIPVELLMHIFKWVVSSELDLKSLEELARVCKGFYTLARDPEIWRLAGLRVWGVNCGSLSAWNGSWRLMYIERPHLWCHGVYISKTSYVRQGEQSLDNYYRPCHHVCYYRYFRFFPDGTVLIHNSPDDPLTAIPRLKFKRGGGNPSVSAGLYRLSGNKVIIVIHKTHSTDGHGGSRNKRGRRAIQVSPILKQVYHMELQIKNNGRKRHNQLLWLHYSCNTTYRATGQTVSSEFDLNRQFPPVFFSVVRSYTQFTSAPLE